MVNKTLVELDLFAPVQDLQGVFYPDYIRETSYNVLDLEAYIADKKPLLNEDQKFAYETIMDQVDKQEGGIIFLDAAGGTGKTFLINLVLAEIRVHGEIVLAVASSGIAATLMEGRRTAHSSLKLPLNISRQESPTCHINKTSGQAQVLIECKLIVWDECTMAHKKSLEALNATLQDLRGNCSLMGGALVLLCGDFRQTLPVIPKSTPADEIYACLKHSVLWNNVQEISLKQNMRILLRDGNAQNFANKLLEIGEDRLVIEASGMIKLSSDLCVSVKTVRDMIQAVYPNVNQNYKNLEWLRERAILAPKNDDVNEINKEILAMLPGDVIEYKSVNTVVDADEAVNYPTEFLNSLDPAGLPQHRLILKVGSPIILLRNLDPPKLCNGTRLCVTKLMKNIIQAVILTGKGKGEIIFIPLIPTDLPFNFKRLQFSVRLAFSITINKSQGQYLKFCGVDLRSPCFSHGQLYVACFRVVSPKNLYILSPGYETKM